MAYYLANVLAVVIIIVCYLWILETFCYSNKNIGSTKKRKSTFVPTSYVSKNTYGEYTKRNRNKTYITPTGCMVAGRCYGTANAKRCPFNFLHEPHFNYDGKVLIMPKDSIVIKRKKSGDIWHVEGDIINLGVKKYILHKVQNHKGLRLMCDFEDMDLTTRAKVGDLLQKPIVLLLNDNHSEVTRIIGNKSEVTLDAFTYDNSKVFDFRPSKFDVEDIEKFEWIFAEASNAKSNDVVFKIADLDAITDYVYQTGKDGKEFITDIIMNNPDLDPTNVDGSTDNLFYEIGIAENNLNIVATTTDCKISCKDAMIYGSSLNVLKSIIGNDVVVILNDDDSEKYKIIGIGGGLKLHKIVEQKLGIDGFDEFEAFDFTLNAKGLSEPFNLICLGDKDSTDALIENITFDFYPAIIDPCA